MRLIDADALMELARNHVGMAVDCNDIARFPTIDAETVRHGRWGASTIVGYDGIHVIYARPCSECGYEDKSFVARYCPNCGAKMDGGAEDEHSPYRLQH